MKNFFVIIKIFTIFLLISSQTNSAQPNYFDKGLKLFNVKNYEESKFLFEQDIVFNPKSEKSYLYLAKIFEEKENEIEVEKNLNNVLLLNPKNEEAIYMLTLLKITQSDYKIAKELINTFNLVCKSLCSKKDQLEKKFKVLIPDNAKDNN
jgi:tetratricopeptide (TPR) repeat protein